MEQKSQYVNKFNVAANNNEVVIQLIQEQPIFDGQSNLTGLANENILNVVMTHSNALGMIHALADCLGFELILDVIAKDEADA